MKNIRHSTIRLFDYSKFSHSSHLRPAFTLLEMMVVIGIIIILIGASVGGYSRMTKAAEKARLQELVSNAATALTALYNDEGAWPKCIVRNGATDGRLDENVAYALVSGSKSYFSLTTANRTLSGIDRFGIVTPWATAVIKRLGTSAALESIVSGTTTIQDHILHYAVDLDGDGIIKGATVGGESVDVRATAIVWSIGKSGGSKGQPWPYSKGRTKSDDVYSWTLGQTQNVK